jgi:predicted deacetylase
MSLYAKRFRNKITLAVLIFAALVSAVSNSAEAKIIVTIRIDDIQSRGTQMPRSILPFAAMVSRHNAKITWAVIPHRLIESQNQDGVLVRELKQTLQQGHEIAQHGYNHICARCGQSGHEFYCFRDNIPFTYDEQRNLVDMGNMILMDSIGIKPKCFVPPGSGGDSTTFRVLDDFSFPYLSSSWQQLALVRGSLFNIPSTAEYTWYLTQTNYQESLNKALADIQSIGAATGYFGLLIHDPFIREGYENGIVIHWLDEFLTALEQRYSSQLEFMTMSEVGKRFRTVDVIDRFTTGGHPKTFSLSNYPNPFNASTTITWRAPYGGDLHLRIYDVLGREVLRRDFPSVSIGEHHYMWNATDVGSGIYSVQVVANNRREVHKLMVIK